MKNRLQIFLLTVLALMTALCVTAFAEETATTEPLVTPAPEELEDLTFVITGPDERMPMTVTYGELKDGSFEMEGLATGTYTVTEVSPEKLLEDFTFDAENSTSSVTIEVHKDGNETGVLENVYRTEAPTAEPTPEPTPEIQKTDIPVTKSWIDDNNRDGNRPSSVTVFLYADGTPVDQAVLDEGNGWAYTFTEKDRTNREGSEIIYTVREAPVDLYTGEVNGYHITNYYTPPRTSASVRKVWDDDQNKAGIRPASLHATLSNGTTVVLSDANGWSAVVENLPAVVNGQAVQYTWREQEALGYEQSSVINTGTETIFTNTLRRRDDLPDRADRPRARGENYIIIQEYGTPLGVNVTINHTGDCFE